MYLLLVYIAGNHYTCTFLAIPLVVMVCFVGGKDGDKMALDGCMLSLVGREIADKVLGGRVDKIHQPTKEEIIIAIRSQHGSYKLLLSAKAAGARVHLTTMSVENPKQPPMFCMLLRKHIGSGRLVNIRQQGFDRVLFFDFEAINELGDTVIITLAVEIMGRHSNIVLLEDNSKKIIDAVKRVNFDMSSVRQIMPGLSYVLPPPQERLSPTTDPATVIDRIKNCGRDISLSKLLLETLEGVSPLLCREISHFATRGRDCIVSEMLAEDFDRLKFYLSSIKSILEGSSIPQPTTVLTLEGSPKDFSFIRINQYASSLITKEYESFGEQLDRFYGEKDAAERMKQRSNDLLKLLVNRTERITRKLAAQKEELVQCKQREQLRMYGDLLAANLHLFHKGDASVTVADFYTEDCREVTIELDPRLSPVQNSQKYYSEYRKADTAEKKLIKLLEEGESELSYLETVFDLLVRARSDNELTAIREELASEGYIRMPYSHKKVSQKLPALKYLSSEGFTILCGRNNLQNDQLTLKTGKNYDLWLHTQKIPGSHTIIVCDGKEIPNRTIEEAAIIAATNSKASASGKVPVDYTYIKHVKKHPANKPGLVNYDNFKTAIVDPDHELVGRLLVK